MRALRRAGYGAILKVVGLLAPFQVAKPKCPLNFGLVFLWYKQIGRKYPYGHLKF